MVFWDGRERKVKWIFAYIQVSRALGSVVMINKLIFFYPIVWFLHYFLHWSSECQYVHEIQWLPDPSPWHPPWPATFETAYCAAAAAKLRQSCPTLCDPIGGSPPGSPVPGILQGRTPEWVAIFFSNAWKWKVKVNSLSRVRLLVTPWTAAYQAPPSMGLSRTAL